MSKELAKQIEALADDYASIKMTREHYSSRLIRLSPAIIAALRAADQRCAELEAENVRLREAIANQANSFNIVGSHYDAAVTALGAMVSEVKRNARATLGQPR